jgi:hypothetical protein
MKTHISGKIFTFISLMILILVSCSKKDDTLSPGIGQTYNPPPAAVIGSIIDSGLVNTDVRVMKMDLSTLPFTLYGVNEEVSYVSASTSAALYVNSDGSIPSGEYTFSEGNSRLPFTFSSAVLNAVAEGDPSVTNPDKITGGTITVNQDGSKYHVSLEINLASGMTASEIFTGSLTYEDFK